MELIRFVRALLGLLLMLVVLPSGAEGARLHILATWSTGMWPSSSLAVSAISADGRTALGTRYRGAATWDQGRLETYAWNGAAQGRVCHEIGGAATAISADGSVFAGTTYTLDDEDDEFVYSPFRWTAETGTVALADIESDTLGYRVMGMSADGMTTVGFQVGGSAQTAFRWTEAEGMTPIDSFAGFPNCRPEGVSSGGSVIVGAVGDNSGDYVGSDLRRAFRWTADGGMIDLSHLVGDSATYANDVSDDGSTIVGWRGNRRKRNAWPVAGVPGDQAFLWTETEGMRGLGFLPGHSWSQATAVSADGSVVVGVSAPVGGSVGQREAFYWDSAHGMRSLATVLGVGNEWLETPADVSADGRTVVGNNRPYPTTGPNDWQPHSSWMAVVPEPTTFGVGLWAVPVFSIYGCRRRRR